MKTERANLEGLLPIERSLTSTIIEFAEIPGHRVRGISNLQGQKDQS